MKGCICICPLKNGRVYLPLYKVADTPFYIQGNVYNAAVRTEQSVVDHFNFMHAPGNHEYSYLIPVFRMVAGGGWCGDERTGTR